MTKLKNSKCDKTQKISILQYQKTQSVTKIKKPNVMKTLQELRIAALRVGRLSRCLGVFTKRCHYNYFCHYCHFYYYHSLSFELSQFYFILILHNLSF